jgi:hypothetical protein
MRILSFLIVWAVGAALLPGEAVAEVNPAVQVASTYFTSLTAGDVAPLAGLSSLPFSADGQRIDTAADLERVHQEVVACMGKRPVPPYTTAAATAAPPLDATVYGTTTTIAVSITGGGHQGQVVHIYLREMEGKLTVAGYDGRPAAPPR